MSARSERQFSLGTVRMIALYKEPITATQLAGECGPGTGVDRMERDSKTFTGMSSLEGRIQWQEESSGRKNPVTGGIQWQEESSGRKNPVAGEIHWQEESSGKDILHLAQALQ